MDELASRAIGRWLGRLGIAIPLIVVGGYLAAIIADLAWDLGLLPQDRLPSHLSICNDRRKAFSFAGCRRPMTS
jgi:hypothetical protein